MQQEQQTPLEHLLASPAGLHNDWMDLCMEGFHGQQQPGKAHESTSGAGTPAQPSHHAPDGGVGTSADMATVFSFLEPVAVRRSPSTMHSPRTMHSADMDTLPSGPSACLIASSPSGHGFHQDSMPLAGIHHDMGTSGPFHEDLAGRQVPISQDPWSPRLKTALPSTPSQTHALGLPSTPSLGLDDGRMSFCQGASPWATTPLSADMFAHAGLLAEPASMQAARQALTTWHSVGNSSPERLRSLSGLLNGSLSAGLQEHQMDVTSPHHPRTTHPTAYCPNCTTQLSEAPCITCPYCYANISSNTASHLYPLDVQAASRHETGTSHLSSPSGLIPDPSLQVAALATSAGHMAVPTSSQAAAGGVTPNTQDASTPAAAPQQAVVIGYDERMLKHSEPASPHAMGREHPERPARLTSIMQQLNSTGLLARCIQVPGRPATDAELQAVHTPELVHNIGLAASLLSAGKPPESPPAPPDASLLHDDLSRQAQDLLSGRQEPGEEAGNTEHAQGMAQVSRWIVDVPMNPHMSECARIAAGTAVDVTLAVLQGRAQHGAAIIRPPGHHAESALSMGFCIYNNAAVAARAAQQAGAHRVLIMDWDVHHGNGTQHMFYDDPSVMYISTHRYDEGFFFPGTGSSREAGDGEGAGFTVNVAWDGPGLTDTDYLNAFRHVVMPIAESFAPDLVIVSAGFDAAKGDPLGECLLTPALYGHLTKMLSSLGPSVLLLEGGYNLAATAACTSECVRVLIEGTTTPIPVPSSRGPSPDALSSLLQTLLVHSAYWPIAQKHLQLLMKEEQERAAEAPEALPAVDANLDVHFSELMKAWGFDSEDEDACI